MPPMYPYHTLTLCPDLLTFACCGLQRPSQGPSTALTQVGVSSGNDTWLGWEEKLMYNKTGHSFVFRKGPIAQTHLA